MKSKPLDPSRPGPEPCSRRRHAILDVLRGVAVLGICLANFGEFSLYTFQSPDVVAAMPTARVDGVMRFFQYLFVDGRFYTLFSLLFGIGFSIVMGRGPAFFYRRMGLLFAIGMCHLVFLWAGDILILYATMGMLLPFFGRVSDRGLLRWAAGLLLLPVVLDAALPRLADHISAPLVEATGWFHDRAGITPDSFPVWLAGAGNYGEVLDFNVAGSFIRLQEFVGGHRALKVLGLFLVGLWIGQRGIYADLAAHRTLLRRVALWGGAIGLPLSVVYAWEAVSGHPMGLAGHSAIYAVSVVPLALAYACGLALWWQRGIDRGREPRLLGAFAAPGRMALTNYIAQSAAGIAIFYGIGGALGARVGLVWVEAIAVGVFALQIVVSRLWLGWFRWGPLEWLWRMATHGRWLRLRKDEPPAAGKL